MLFTNAAAESADRFGSSEAACIRAEEGVKRLVKYTHDGFLADWPTWGGHEDPRWVCERSLGGRYSDWDRLFSGYVGDPSLLDCWV